MAIITLYLQILLLVIFLSILYYCSPWRYITLSRRSLLPYNWPLLGMTPGLLCNAHRLLDFATYILKETGGTCAIKGPWFTTMDMVITSDPADIHYVLSKNFSNYTKGPEHKKIFEVLGDGIFSSDAELWKLQRQTTMSLMKLAKFQDLLERVTRHKIEKGLVPILDHVCGNATVVDLQDILQRFTFDGICSLLLDYDPQSLSIDLPPVELTRAIHDAQMALSYRYIWPERCWKLQKMLRIGMEKKLSEACESIDQFIYHSISLKKSNKSRDRDNEVTDSAESFSMLTSIMEAYREEGGTCGDPNKFLRDILLSLILAGRDTTSTVLSWFFWLLANNPLVEIKIQEEIIKTRKDLKLKEEGKGSFFFKAEELHKLVYLHAALCEALRLYPSVPFVHKTPVERDTLPSGHWVDEKTKVVLNYYSMGRMETIWGKDCLEFKPERWISETTGRIKHQPSYIFPAFSAGPRSCIGKDMSFTQMKIVATIIIYNYKVQVVKDQTITSSNPVILTMKHGLKVKITKRSV